MAASIIILSGCNSEEPVQPLQAGDYMPLTPGTEWQYQRWVVTPDQNQPVSLDTAIIKITEETAIDGKMYAVFTDRFGMTDKAVRVENSQYFGRDHEMYVGLTHEYMFLDTEKLPGDSWSYIKNDGATKTEYVVKAKGTSFDVLGTTYEDVIEMQVNYYSRVGDEYEKKFSAVHVYAKGVGEIYTYYPVSPDTFGELVAYLIPQKGQ